VSTPGPAEMVDKLAIIELVQLERFGRDTREWGLMADCYAKESRVWLSWFDGNALEFIEASRKMSEQPGGEAIHELGPTLVTLNGDRAIADTSCTILMRRVFEGVECDLTVYCRHRSRVERVDGTWKLRTLVGIYQKNTLAPVVPGQLPAIDVEKLSSFRLSYNYQSYYRAAQGHVPFDDRPGIDRPELVNELVSSDLAWLHYDA
jgi:hypothetical protein